MFSALYNGQRLNAFSLTAKQWDEIRASSHHHDISPLRSSFSNAPMMTVERSGLRFFRMFSGCESGLTEPETMHHIRLKTAAVHAAKALGFNADTEVPSPSRSWIADVLVQRPGKRPLAIEIQWSYQNEDEYIRRTQRYADSGVDCLWLSAHMPLDDWEEHSDAPDAKWSGIKFKHGVVRLPVNKNTEQVRLNGEWMGCETVITRVLKNELKVVERHESQTLHLYEEYCWKCGNGFFYWLVEYGNTWQTGHREEEDYTQQAISRYRSLHGSLPAASIETKYSNTVKHAYRAFTCPNCHCIQGDFFLGRSDSLAEFHAPSQEAIRLLEAAV